MSTELVKWKPANAGRKIDEALARIRRSEIVIRRAEPSAVSVRKAEPFGEGKPGEVVDLPRVCAIHDKPWAARYIRGRNGHFHHAQTLRVTEALYLSQYGESDRWEIPVSDVGDETCPWCGASGFGAVRCGGCKHDVCYGRTVSGYFRCRASCGGEGKIVRSHYRLLGQSPFSGSGGFST